MPSQFDRRLQKLIEDCWRNPHGDPSTLRERALRLAEEQDDQFNEYLQGYLIEALSAEPGGGELIPSQRAEKLSDLSLLIAGLAVSEFGLDSALYQAPGAKGRRIAELAKSAGLSPEKLLTLDRWWRIDSGKRS